MASAPTKKITSAFLRMFYITRPYLLAKKIVYSIEQQAKAATYIPITPPPNQRTPRKKKDRRSG